MKTHGKIVSLVLATIMCLGMVSFTGCFGNDTNSTAEASSYMTVDINPSIEFTLDKNNKIVSVTALNDDGAVLVSGSAFVGKTAEEGAKLVVKLATEQGYLVKGEASSTDNEVNIAVTGNTETAKKIYENVKTKVNKYIEDSGIAAAVKEGEAKGLEELRKMAIAMGLDEDEAAKMDVEALIEYIGESRKETAELMSEELRQMYYKAKNTQIKVAENEAVVKAIGTANETYTKAVESLNSAKEALKEAETKILDAYNTYFVSADSDYQKALKDVLDAKAAYNKQKAEVAEMADGVEKTLEEGILAGKKSALDTADLVLSTAKTTAEAAIKVASTAFDEAYKAIDSIKASWPEEIQTVLTSAATEIDTAVNTAKDSAFADFEKLYKTQIEAYNTMIENAQKAQKAQKAE